MGVKDTGLLRIIVCDAAEILNPSNAWERLDITSMTGCLRIRLDVEADLAKLALELCGRTSAGSYQESSLLSIEKR